MSRIGNKIINITNNIKIYKKKNFIYIKGKLGVLKLKLNKKIDVKLTNNKIIIINNYKNNKTYKGLHGLYRMLIYNMIKGVSVGYNIELELVGIGYKAETNKLGNILILNLGYSHSIIFHVCNKIHIKVDNIKGSNIIINLFSIDKQLLGEVASKIRSLRKPDKYKGKGIRYKNEIIKLKAGKTV
ncbi:MAG: 50S ribosomal protein L6 [Candidatus Shikimatogenerans bostrichidophilus]|nr:MAG: 50S ribosomal protein L6 [Candidatus Shikimatogenerans bostrichidophilus]